MDSTGPVPVLDFGKLRGASSERSAAVLDIGTICQKKGFFQVLIQFSSCNAFHLCVNLRRKPPSL
jgi:isopenicillin N synthase-like dioxygenase